MTYIVNEFLPLIAHHDNQSAEMMLRQLAYETVYEFFAVYFHHTFGVVFGVFTKSPPHAGSQYYCLHNFL